MANTGGTQGGTHEQHVKAGAQSHKNTNPPGKAASTGANREKTGQRGGSEQKGSEQKGKTEHQGPKSS
jgi:uncharacterized protein